MLHESHSCAAKHSTKETPAAEACRHLRSAAAMPTATYQVVDILISDVCVLQRLQLATSGADMSTAARPDRTTTAAHLRLQPLRNTLIPSCQAD